MERIGDGDRLIVSGPVGDHAIAVMLAREAFELRGSLHSDCAAVTPLTEPIADLPGLHFMRDPTRGGLATVAHEIAAATGFDIHLSETAVPVRDEVRSVCRMLGYDPYYLACEGRVLAVAEAAAAEQILALWKGLPQGREASIVGHVDGGGQGRVILGTSLGGQRLLEELEDDPLPRIC
jgi:hydrogenase expression/formation protein HypE